MKDGMSIKGEVFMREISLRLNHLKRKSLEIVGRGSSKFRGSANNSLQISAGVEDEEEGENVEETGGKENKEAVGGLPRTTSLLGRGAELLVSVIGNSSNNSNSSRDRTEGTTRASRNWCKVRNSLPLIISIGKGGSGPSDSNSDSDSEFDTHSDFQDASHVSLVLSGNLKAGNFIGYKELMRKGKYTYTVIASEACKYYTLQRTDIMKLIIEHPDIALELQSALGNAIFDQDQLFAENEAKNKKKNFITDIKQSYIKTRKSKNDLSKKSEFGSTVFEILKKGFDVKVKKKKLTSNNVSPKKPNPMKRTEISVKIASHENEISYQDEIEKNQNGIENKNENLKIYPTSENFSKVAIFDNSLPLSLPITRSLPISSMLECVSIDVENFDENSTFPTLHTNSVKKSFIPFEADKTTATLPSIVHIVKPNTPGFGTPGFGTPGFGTPGFGTPGFGTPGFDTPGRKTFRNEKMKEIGIHLSNEVKNLWLTDVEMIENETNKMVIEKVAVGNSTKLNSLIANSCDLIPIEEMNTENNLLSNDLNIDNVNDKICLFDCEQSHNHSHGYISPMINGSCAYGDICDTDTSCISSKTKMKPISTTLIIEKKSRKSEQITKVKRRNQKEKEKQTLKKLQNILEYCSVPSHWAIHSQRISSYMRHRHFLLSNVHHLDRDVLPPIISSNDADRLYGTRTGVRLDLTEISKIKIKRKNTGHTKFGFFAQLVNEKWNGIEYVKKGEYEKNKVKIPILTNFSRSHRSYTDLMNIPKRKIEKESFLVDESSSIILMNREDSSDPVRILRRNSYPCDASQCDIYDKRGRERMEALTLM